MKDHELYTHDLLNAQTGRISWPELARYFARGLVVCVCRGEDLVAVAEMLIGDDAQEVSKLYEDGLLHRALDEDAMRWQEENTAFWAVVVAPWVLVQEV
ncbi:MAG: DUF2288 domain-containing protein [Xanthomonadales bacterium]|jgi:hypothetical protein|nr:DUF2288 domain-containing protein [Xanthomonadales bacterium]